MYVSEFRQKKQKNQKIKVLTCYDYTFAKLLNETSVDALLVGDSLAMVMLGFENTIYATIELMAIHTSSVARGAPKKFIIGDLPFLSFRKDLNQNMSNIELLIRAGAQAVKLEGAIGNIGLIKHCVESGVPVMGHLGLTPQMIHGLSGHKVQGRLDRERQLILDQSKALEDAGCFSIVLECVPASLATEISQILKIPTIGIGAGPSTDGQVLVLQDMLGMNEGFEPKFLRKYLDAAALIKTSVQNFCQDIDSGVFPGEKETYDN